MLYPYLLILVAVCRGNTYTNAVKCQGAVTIGTCAKVGGSIGSGGALTIGSNVQLSGGVFQSVGAMSVHNNVSMYANRVDVGGALTIGDLDRVQVKEVLHATGAVTLGAYTNVSGTVNTLGPFTKGQGTSCTDSQNKPCETSDKKVGIVVPDFNIYIQRDVPTMENCGSFELDDKRHLEPGTYTHSAAWSLPAGETMTFSGNYTPLTSLVTLN